MTQGQGGGVPPTMAMPGFQPQGFAQQQQQQPPPPAPQAPPPALPAKKSRWGMYVGGGCAGCLSILCVLCGIGGYLFYLEEGTSYDDPGEEILSQPIVSGVPFTTNVTWDGTGYGDIRAYVDVGTNVSPGERISGSFGCENYAGGGTEERPIEISYYGSYGDTPPAGWISLQNYTYRRGSPDPFPCGGTLNLPASATSPRLIITVKQRPSDWIEEYF